MSTDLISFYVSWLTNESMFKKRTMRVPGLANYDPVANWVHERYLWVSTAKTDAEYRARCEARNERKRRK